MTKNNVRNIILYDYRLHDLSKKHGIITIPSPDNKPLIFHDTDIQLSGIKTIWSRSLLLRNTAADSTDRACTNIVNNDGVKTVEAIFASPIAGKIIIRENTVGETSIFTNLYHTGDGYNPSSNHEWKILATDIVGNNKNPRNNKCEYLQLLYEQGNINDTNCSNTNHKECKVGDLTKKHGKVVVGSGNTRYSKKFFIDTNLPLISASGSRNLYVVLYEKDNSYRIKACAIMVTIKPKEVKAYFNHDGVKGYIRFSQSYRMDPTVVTIDLKNLRGRGSGFHVHMFPVPYHINQNDNLCGATGGHYNPFQIDPSTSPKPGLGTNDQYELGDLSGKYGLLDAGPIFDFYFNIHADFNLPLFGTYSIVGRSVVIHRPDGSRWICSTIGYPEPVTIAHANFMHPVVGRVVFKQQAGNPWGETTVHAWLSYSDGTQNNTENHRWDIHESEAGRDFYNWSKRCESAGKDYNPHFVGTKKYERCNQDNPLRCKLGDLTGKHGRIKITATRDSLGTNQIFYTDVLLPLEGIHSIIGRSLVVHDDQAPPFRGDRLACTTITYYHGLKATVRNLAVGRQIESNVTGLFEFSQQDFSDPTEAKVEIRGLDGLASGYHVHMVPVPISKEFPCTDDSVYGHFNPFNINVSLGPAAGVGSVDQYEVGDLSGKFGTLDGKDEERNIFHDINLPLHGKNSIIGRSVVIHKKERNFRWACGSIEPVFSKKDDVQLISAIASFDKIDSFIQGYVRMRQLKYPDGSMSETWIEVDLRYPGKYTRDITTGHKWAIYVNQVGHDAVEKVEKVRCISAGFIWNPYTVKTDDDLYKKDCHASNPLRCAMGDLSGRHGTVEIGGRKKVFSDMNLPLVGNFSVMKRSLVIFDENGGTNKIGCANIGYDNHLEHYVNVMKHPGFTSATFMDKMRELLNASDWLVVQDAQSEKEIEEGKCVQIKVSFYGPEAYRLQIEFENLLKLGSVQRRTKTGLKLVKTYYKPCAEENGQLPTSYSTSVIWMALISCLLNKFSLT
ncbi:uncharacterized protein LOC111625338 [Centruroides sculpturatus]|uniref:uncharacterized protein LOC111625338 n=1 Tax=Centruroides sculpturatus TaxID=218467 RepID=UPI000C6D714B|nr:uncharacterized protein LOC111625338 [Centruroides sculpturatus]